MHGVDAYAYARGMEMTASALRRDIYRVLDRVLETGEPVLIERHGRRIRITAESVPSRLDSLVRRIGLQRSDLPPEALVDTAATLTWTRNPFDRLIVADALVSGTALLTKDRTIHDGTTIARW